MTAVCVRDSCNSSPGYALEHDVSYHPGPDLVGVTPNAPTRSQAPRLRPFSSLPRGIPCKASIHHPEIGALTVLLTLPSIPSHHPTRHPTRHPCPPSALLKSCLAPYSHHSTPAQHTPRVGATEVHDVLLRNRCRTTPSHRARDRGEVGLTCSRLDDVGRGTWEQCKANCYSAI